MTSRTLNLKAVDELIRRHSEVSGWETRRLLEIIRGHFKTESDLESLGHIPPEDIKARLQETQPPIPGDRFKSLKIALNEELRTLALQEHKPVLLINEENVFVQEEGVESESPGSPPPGSSPESPASRRPFRVSEMTFHLPEELRQEFQNQVDRLQKLERSLRNSLEEARKREKNLEQEKLQLEQENADLRTRTAELQKTLDRQFDRERQSLKGEIDRWKKDSEAAREALQNHRTAPHRLDAPLESRRAELETRFLEREAAFRAKFDEMTELMEQLADQEIQFTDLRRQALQTLRDREQASKRESERLAQKARSLAAQGSDLDREKRTHQAKLEQDLKVRTQKQHQEFTRRTHLLIRRSNELDEREDLLRQKQETLLTREHQLAEETQTKTDALLKKKRDALADRERELQQKQQALLQEEKNLLREKKEFLSQWKGHKKVRPQAERFQRLVGDQEEVLRRRYDILNALEKQKKRLDREWENTLQTCRQEKEQTLEDTRRRREELRREARRLQDKEQELLRRETSELARLNEEFQDFQNSVEVQVIEKETELQKQKDHLRQKELELLQREEQNVLMQKAGNPDRRREDDEITAHLEALRALREQGTAHQRAVQRFLDEFQSTYARLLADQKTQGDAMQKKWAELKEEADRIAQEGKERKALDRAERAAADQNFRDRFQHWDSLTTELESDLQNKVREYQERVRDLGEMKEKIDHEEASRNKEMRDSLLRYEQRLTRLGEAFQDLSEAFHREKEQGTLQIVPEDSRPTLQIDDALARTQWPLALRRLLGLAKAEEKAPHLEDAVHRLAEPWDVWVPIPAGRFNRADPNSPASASPQQTILEKPFRMRKYPVTNVEFYQFVQETDFRTEAEQSITGIVYHPGRQEVRDPEGRILRETYTNPTLAANESAFWVCPDGHPDSLYWKPHHPVTQVSWHDAEAYCRWKSEKLGRVVRLPTEAEWEYVATHLGRLAADRFFWTLEEAVRACNIEETGRGGTTAGDHFPEHEVTAGVQDLFGNVFEWVQPTESPRRPSGRDPGKYRAVRGGSFLTPYKHLAPRQRLIFLANYCTSFIGFRTVLEDD